MTAFADAVDDLFNDPNMGHDALYFAAGQGAGRPVRVVKRLPDRIGNFTEGRFVAESVLIDVRLSEVAHLQRDDTFQIAGVTYQVRSDPVRDTMRLVWAAEAREI